MAGTRGRRNPCPGLPDALPHPGRLRPSRKLAAHQIIREAPALCIEVLSPEDRLSRVLTRCEDFHSMGVPEVWIFHPAKRHVLVVRPGAVIETVKDGSLTLEGTPISLPLADVFGALDK